MNLDQQLYEVRDLEIICTSKESVVESFDRIANKLFHNYVLHVNQSCYRLIDIEFYYYAPEVFEDVYAHQHKQQLEYGKWYFHGSGIDITLGNGMNHGGILVRGIAKISENASPHHHYIEAEIQGPLKVKTEICSNLHSALEGKPNLFHLRDLSKDGITWMSRPEYTVKTKRIGLNPIRDNSSQAFYNGKFRYIIFPHLKLRDKQVIANDMREQLLGLTDKEINKALGSIFIK